MLSQEEFERTHGRRPWDVINELLRSIDSFGYQVTTPERLDKALTFKVELKSTTRSGLTIGFEHLSSGERVLMALVATVYRTAADKRFPEYLLLDEIDASLHPSMIKWLLAIIEKEFLPRDTRVLLATHSPTTIALVPEHSVFLMERDGTKRIRTTSRSEALNTLTEGYATLEEGLTLFDQIAKSEVTILSEGDNNQLIQRALEIHAVDDVDVLMGMEDITGAKQLKTLFQFLTRARLSKKVIIVWDCDEQVKLSAENNVYPFMMPRNTANTLATRGIENAFPEALFENFTTYNRDSHQDVTIEFDPKRKKDFLQYVLARNDPDDFLYFKDLINEIERIKCEA